MPSTLEPKNSFVNSNLSTPEIATHYVDAAEFRRLIVSNRRMERADNFAPKMRGLRDLKTGELFLTDERWLIDGKR
ncbi:hypothetical protein [Anatilimnocola floriformis]|uniref:hypothetical protein n=1 Tax=Anatilimnocola floriformis TaxID=2948575 RepID=UPI0020C4D6D3|nr:hypothetical protein [Anatilimnocola floriformis]